MPEKSLLSLKELLSSILAYIPSLLAGLAVLLLGLVAAWITARLAVRLLIVLRLDRVFRRIGWGGALAKGDVRHVLFELLGTVVGGFVFLVFLDNAIIIWRLTVLSRLLDELVLLIPNLVVATLVLMVGWGVAAAVARSVRHALYQEGFERPGLIARVVRSAILVLTTAIALVKLDLAPQIVSDAFVIAFGAFGLSFVLAIGLGSKHAVEAMWRAKLSRRQEQNSEETDPAKPHRA